MFGDSDGESSEDDNFSLYGGSQTEDEDSLMLSPKKRTQNIYERFKKNLKVLRFELCQQIG